MTEHIFHLIISFNLFGKQGVEALQWRGGHRLAWAALSYSAPLLSGHSAMRTWQCGMSLNRPPLLRVGSRGQPTCPPLHHFASPSSLLHRKQDRTLNWLAYWLKPLQQHLRQRAYKLKRCCGLRCYVTRWKVRRNSDYDVIAYSVAICQSSPPPAQSRIGPRLITDTIYSRWLFKLWILAADLNANIQT